MADPRPIGTDSQRSFISQYMPLAVQLSQRLKVAPEVLLGQWGLETGWGKSIVPGTNNLGNIKDFSGSGVAAKDNYNGSRDKYKKYSSPEEFGEHFAQIMQDRYKDVVNAGSNAAKYFQTLLKGGYAEKPTYVTEGVTTSRRVAQIADSIPGLKRNPAPVDQPPAPTDAEQAMTYQPQETVTASLQRMYDAGKGLLPPTQTTEN